MNPQIKRLWIEALEADDAPPQGRSYLGRPDGSRCCLGVLCDLAVKHGVIQEPTEVEGSGEHVLRYGNRAEGDTSIHALPEVVQIWAGLYSANPIVDSNFTTPSGRAYTLAEVNDNGGDFKLVAQLVRGQL